MNFNFKSISLSHRKAPVEIRELFHFSSADALALMGRVREILGIEELMVLSTCNRTELYYTAEEDLYEDLVKVLCIEKGLEHPERYFDYFENFTDNFEAVNRLFEVSMGLDSAVIGDLQISNQVKVAYAGAHEMQMAGPFLHRLMHTIFHTNKRVHQETPYRDGAASVSYAAAELAAELTLLKMRPSALVLGLGEMGRDVALSLKKDHFGRVCLMNRTATKAEELATEMGVEWQPIEKLHEIAGQFDVVISAAAVPAPILTPTSLDTQGAQQFYVDLSVPRSIAREMDDLPGIVVYDIDDIRTRTDEVVNRRLESEPKVREIIAQEMTGFLDWSRELSISPTIQRLKDALENIRKEEIARFLKNADEHEKALVDKVTRSMMNKIIKLPILQLKDACKRGEEENLIGVLNDLFNLEQTREKA